MRWMLLRFSLVGWLVSGVLATSADFNSAPRSSGRPPNILIILADDLGFSDLGCYGGEIPTPHLDGLARAGLRFSQFYNTARCWPSRAALLTGYYAQQVRRDTVPGIPSGVQGRRPAWARLLPEMLRPAGYRSYHSGKWHVDGKPLLNGFDRSYSLEDHDRYFAPRNHTENDQPLPPVLPGTPFYTTTAIAEHAIQCLRDHATNYPERPFLEYLAFTAPHFPLQAPEADRQRYRERYRSGWDVGREDRWKRQKKLGLGVKSLSAVERDVGPPYAFPEALRQLGPNEVNRLVVWDSLTADQQAFQAEKMAVHAAMVDRMDREIGRVLDQLRAMGAFENTLILFLSDNGASAEMMVRGDGHNPDAACGTGATFLSLGPGWSTMANTPFRRHKTWVHEGGISTAFIAHWPAGIAARGEWRHTSAHLVDIVPTLRQLAGVPTGAEFSGGERSLPKPPGHSLVPVFRKDGKPLHEALWWQHEGNRALRQGRWKLVAAGTNAGWELYDLQADRAEGNNLAAKYPERVRQMAQTWSRLTAEHGVLARQGLP